MRESMPCCVAEVDAARGCRVKEIQNRRSRGSQVELGDDDAAKGSVELMEDVPPQRQILAEVRLSCTLC